MDQLNKPVLKSPIGPLPVSFIDSILGLMCTISSQ